jgi:regulator of nonsense transcripts 1
LEESRNFLTVAKCLWDPINVGHATLKLQVNPKRLMPDVEVGLFLTGESSSWSAFGKIISVTPSKVTEIRVLFDLSHTNNMFPQSITTGYQLKIDAWSEITFMRMNGALETFQTDSTLTWLCQALVGAPTRIAARSLPSPTVSGGDLHSEAIKKLASIMNRSQVEAVQQAIKAPVSLIQGPPGTGKTTVSVQLIKTLVKEGKVLVCAPSNVVTDHLADKLAQETKELESGEKEIDVVRVVARSREENSANLPNALHVLCTNEFPEYAAARQRLKRMTDSMEDPDEFRRLMKICLGLENARLDRADVIVATCIGAGDGRIVTRRFQSVIIDEATQAVEPTCLVPAVLSTHRVVLVGDHQQLGPVVIDNRAQVLGLGRSLFQRLVDLGVPRIRLDIQYRMHPHISVFPNRTFYQGTLGDGVSADARRFAASFFPLRQSPTQKDSKVCFFWNIPTLEEWDSRGRSYINRIEARRVEQLVDALPNASDVGVITFYDGQRSILQGALAGKCEVNSVDGFQGREKEVVVLSAVRANLAGRIGFLDDFRRVNVAITRAKRVLVVCGNISTIRAANDRTWSSFLEHLDAQNAIFEGDSVYALRPVSLLSAR